MQFDDLINIELHAKGRQSVRENVCECVCVCVYAIIQSTTNQSQAMHACVATVPRTCLLTLNLCLANI